MFTIFALFSYFAIYKMPKMQATYLCAVFRLFHVVWKGHMGAFLQVGFSCNVCWGAGNLQTCPKFSPKLNACVYANKFIILLHGASELEQQGLKTRYSAQGCAFWKSERRFPKFWKSPPPQKKTLKFLVHGE